MTPFYSLHNRHRSRRGFTLLEMLLALAILGSSLAILAQIASTGVDAAREARALSTARMICQTKLAEVLLNIESGQTPTSIIEAPTEPFDSASTETYLYSVTVMPGQLDGLLSLRITVVARAGDGTEQLAAFAIDRWVIDPAIGLEEAELEEEAAREEIANGGEEPIA